MLLLIISYRYIASSGHVRAATVECSLTALCLQYLTFECFESDIERDRIRFLALDGHLAFQDYAVAKWFHHFKAMLDVGQGLLTGDQENEAVLEEIEDALDAFVVFYGNDTTKEPVASGSEEACEGFKNRTLYGNLLAVWSHIYRHQHRPFEERNNVSLKQLADAFSRNRTLLEDLASSGQTVFLQTFYGDGKTYKCSKLPCFHFHEGFKDARGRDDHVKRHDRPFNCNVPDYSAAEFGFSSNNDLERHIRNFHPDFNDKAKLFPVVNSAALPTNAKRRFKCNQCDKSFTRNFHLKSHLLNHSGRRPYSCPECGKAFARGHDCKRHQELHARGR